MRYFLMKGKSPKKLLQKVYMGWGQSYVVPSASPIQDRILSQVAWWEGRMHF